MDQQVVGSNVIINDAYALMNESFMLQWRADRTVASSNRARFLVTRGDVNRVPRMSSEQIEREFDRACSQMVQQISHAAQRGMAIKFVMIDCSTIGNFTMTVEKFRRTIATDSRTMYFIIDSDVNYAEICHKLQFADKYSGRINSSHLHGYREFLRQIGNGELDNVQRLSLFDNQYVISHKIMYNIELAVLDRCGNRFLAKDHPGLRNEMNDDYQRDMLLFFKHRLLDGNASSLIISDDKGLLDKCHACGISSARTSNFVSNYKKANKAQHRSPPKGRA